MEHQGRATECEEEGTKDELIHSPLFRRLPWILHAFLPVASAIVLLDGRGPVADHLGETTAAWVTYSYSWKNSVTGL